METSRLPPRNEIEMQSRMLCGCFCFVLLLSFGADRAHMHAAAHAIANVICACAGLLFTRPLALIKFSHDSRVSNNEKVFCEALVDGKTEAMDARL